MKDERVERWIDGLIRRNLEGIAPKGPLTDAVREQLSVPEFLPPVRRAGYGIMGYEAMVEVSGNLWLGLATDPSEDASEKKLLRGYTKGGDPLNDIVLDASVRPLEIRGDTFWGVQTDDLGVPHLARYRLATSHR